MSGSPPTCIDTSDIAAKRPPAKSRMPLISRRRFWRFPWGADSEGALVLVLAAIGGVLVVGGGLTPTSDYPDRQFVKFPSLSDSGHRRRRTPKFERSLTRKSSYLLPLCHSHRG